jgi:hypothetical protein
VSIAGSDIRCGSIATETRCPLSRPLFPIAEIGRQRLAFYRATLRRLALSAIEHQSQAQGRIRVADIVPADRGIKPLCDVLPGGAIPVPVRQMAQQHPHVGESFECHNPGDDKAATAGGTNPGAYESTP